MAGIKSIEFALNKLGEDKVRQLLSQEVRVTEMFDAFRFSFEKNPKTNRLQYYGKNGKTPLSLVDRTISNLYESAIEYLENLPREIRRTIPTKHRFGFSWFPTTSPLNTTYEKRPKNGLILTDITIRNNRSEVIKDVKEQQVYQRWSDIFHVDYAKPIFEGVLSKESVDSILLGNINESQVYTTGFLSRQNESYEALVIETADQLFKVGRDQENTNEPRSHVFDVLLLDVCEHLEAFDLSLVKNSEKNLELGYVQVVSEVFNDYVEKRGADFLESGLEKPKFLKNSGDLNTKWVKNSKTLTILESDSRFQYLFTVFLANLRKPKFKSGLISESVAESFNHKIQEIDRIAGDDYGFLEFSPISREEALQESLVLENVVEGDVLPQKTDYVRAVLLLSRFFDPDKQDRTGKKPINIIITNAAAFTLDLLEEAERLKKLNGSKSLLIHCDYLRKKSYGVEESALDRLLSELVNQNSDLFYGYRTVERPILRKILDLVRPDHEPALVFTECGAEDLKKEIDGIRAVNTSDQHQLEIDVFRKKRNKDLESALEKDDMKKFTALTPDCLHNYWNQIKSSFDQYAYV